VVPKLPESRKGRNLPNSFYGDNINGILKTDKDTTKKEVTLKLPQ
jgi:hypothetical protein